MDLSSATWWWVAAGVLVVAEMATGTFYLLMIALGAAAGAVAAHAGGAATAQVVAFALVGGGATALWHLRRARAPRSAPAPANADMLIDIGMAVQVPRWEPDGTAQVQYRGAAWRARFAGPGPAEPGPHVVAAVHGSELSLRPAPPAN